MEAILRISVFGWKEELNEDQQDTQLVEGCCVSAVHSFISGQTALLLYLIVPCSIDPLCNAFRV